MKRRSIKLKNLFFFANYAQRLHNFSLISWDIFLTDSLVDLLCSLKSAQGEWMFSGCLHVKDMGHNISLRERNFTYPIAFWKMFRKCTYQGIDVLKVSGIVEVIYYGIVAKKKKKSWAVIRLFVVLLDRPL